MATKTSRKSGENHLVTFGATPLGTARQTRIRLTVRTADARGSGDPAPVDKEIGLESGEVQVTYLIADEATLALVGTYASLVLTDSGGAAAFTADCLLKDLQRREAHDEMTILDALFTVQSIPTVPDLSALDFTA